jgi:hypothetical protein
MQKALKAIDAPLLALEAMERALQVDNRKATTRELWSTRRNLLTLNMMIERERAN